MKILPEGIEDFADDHSTHPTPLFRDLAETTRRETSTAGMMSGATVGNLLHLLIAAMGARRVLEVGTFTGYSALMMASALPDDGKLITCDIDEKNTSIARRFWAQSPHGKKIELRLGAAVETLKQLDGPFDFIFIDADKDNYPAYYEAALPLLAARGLIVIDNTLWSGRVVPEAGEPEDDTTATMRELNDRIVADDRVVCVQLPVRDGITLVRHA